MEGVLLIFLPSSIRSSEFLWPLVSLIWSCHKQSSGPACQCESAQSPPTASNPAPGKCQVEFSAWVNGMCTVQPSMSAEYSTWNSPSQNPKAGEMRDGRGKKPAVLPVSQQRESVHKLHETLTVCNFEIIICNTCMIRRQTDGDWPPFCSKNAGLIFKPRQW